MANKDLLPPDDSLLLPADETRNEADDLFDQMSGKVAAGAKILGSKAAEIAAEQGPVLKEQAQKLGTRMLDAAAQARDPGFWEKYKRRFLGGAALLVLLAGGGYEVGCYKAGELARDAVDGYLIRSHLQKQVSYQDISATPFGRVTLSGVKLDFPLLGQPIELSSLSIGGLAPDGKVPDRLEVGWSGLVLPARSFLSGEALAAFSGAGFQTLRGEGSFSWALDSGSHQLTVKTSGSFTDAGRWDFEASFTNADPPALGRMAEAGLTSLMTIQVKSVSGSLDLGGLARRAREIPRTALPAAEEQPLFDTQPAMIGTSLVEAGMAPSEARETAEALQKFAQTGTRISLKSRMERPVPLFTHITNLPALLAALKISLST
jgi:hypothetical protein